MNNSLYIVGVDGTKNSVRAINFACKLAKQTGASLLLAHVINWSGYMPISPLEVAQQPIEKEKEEEFAKKQILAPAQKAAEAKGIKAETWYDWGHPAKKIEKLATQKKAVMVIMGKSGHGTVTELVLGSISNSLAHHTSLPVVLVP